MEKVDSGKNYTIDSSIFNSFTKSADSNVFVILLNQKFDGESTLKLIAISDYFICADGGANRLYDHLREESERIKYKPHKIVGDLDSLKKVTREFYESWGVGIDYRDSQDEGDMEKSLESLKQIYSENEGWQKKKENRVFITGSFGKRLDHTLNNLSILHKYSKIFDENFGNFTICLLGDSSIAYCFLPGSTKYVRSTVFESNRGIGLIPLCGPAEYVNTKGFRWDLGGDLARLEFGSFVSSSNEFVSTEQVQVQTSAPLILTIPFKEKAAKKRKEEQNSNL